LLPGGFRCDHASMWNVRQVEVEPAPPLTPEAQLAECERECAETEAAFNAAHRALRDYYNLHQQAFKFRSGETLYIQTRIDDLQPQRLDRALQKATERRNAAWSARADLRFKFGLSK
jgi:hypothetical protein